MIPLPNIDTGGGAFTPSLAANSSAKSGDVYSTTNAKQGGLTINKGLYLPSWAMGSGLIGAIVVGGILLWKKK